MRAAGVCIFIRSNLFRRRPHSGRHEFRNHVKGANQYLDLESWQRRLNPLNDTGLQLAYIGWLQQAFSVVLLDLTACLPLLLFGAYITSLGKLQNVQSLKLACTLVFGFWFFFQFFVWIEHLFNVAATSHYTQITRSFHQTLEVLLDKEDKPHLIVLAHSQGTVIAADILFGQGQNVGIWSQKSEEGPCGLKDRISSLTLITFGSPYSHIYQHYFPQAYPKLAELEGTIQAAGINSNVNWINAYRIDDYAGTFIENSIANFPQNISLPLGGHRSYWQEEVFQRIFSMPEIEHLITPINVADAREVL